MFYRQMEEIEAYHDQINNAEKQKKNSSELENSIKKNFSQLALPQKPLPQEAQTKSLSSRVVDMGQTSIYKQRHDLRKE